MTDGQIGRAATLAVRSRGWRAIEPRFIAAWLLSFAIVLYLALDGGGYDLVVRNQVGIAVWWGVLLCGVLGLLPNRPRGRIAWIAAGGLGCFLLWTGLGVTWSVSTERSFAELSRVACYLGVFALGLAIHRDREQALRHTLGAMATAVTVVAAVAVLSRLRPETFSAAGQTASLLPGTQGRLAWPLNYWNGLSELMVLGLPVLLGLACSARRLVIRATAAGVAPLVVLCSYLTFSRGGAIAGAIAVIVFVLLSRDRPYKVLTGLVVAGGSAVLIMGAVHRSAIENGLTNASAQSQGRDLLIAVIVVCIGTALLQASITLAERHLSLPGWTRPRPVRARAATAGAVIVAVVVAVAAGGPGWLSRRWDDFKRPAAAGLSANKLGRYGVISGNGRYQLWQVAVDAAEQKLGKGWGPGTYALIYPPRAQSYDPVQNAHSLYLETFAEEGIVGLVLLVTFLGAILTGAVAAAVRARHETRTQAAAAAGACVAFLLSAAVDWGWQLPVIPCAFLLVGAATLVPGRRHTLVRAEVDSAEAPSGPTRPATRARILRRAGLAILALGCLFVIAVPLAETTALRASQAAAGRGAAAAALSDAETAARIDPDAASPQLQVALVLETQRQFIPAITYARKAVADEPLSWGNWLVLSRLEAEAGHSRLAVRYFKRARSLNPTSPLFRL